ncbi:transcript variant X2 [Nothobranchius furzeri]|uniref:Transcript variant X1 n=1 Tax=Nothobranchius furzeri TaxID=105023 RepID=A0A9D2Y2U0_NOTFU|nr:transcript variant X1 [Nothobranchius furzeri]KAF7211759.1 transcript variant X2 [Nothobranchius furzeri]
MDQNGQFDREGRTISQVQVDGFDLCDNSPSAEALAAQTRNLNEIKALTQNLPLSQSDEGGTCGLIQKPSPNDSGKEWKEVEKGNEVHTGMARDENEEEDIDDAMEEESETSSSLVCCQSPDIPMTDSSYSETGSLLETLYPFSPGTSPEPTSPVIPVVSPETLHPISSLDLSQSGAVSIASMTGGVTCTHGPSFTTGPVDFNTQGTTSDPCLGSPACTFTEDSDRRVKESLTSPCGSTSSRGAASSAAGHLCSGAVTSTSPEPTQLNSSTAASTTAEVLTTGLNPANIEFTSVTSPLTSNHEQNTSTSETTSSSFSTCSTGSVLSPTHLESLEQLAQRDDDTHLPRYLHQIAESFVLQKDYQRALWFIQLERLYHQRVLDNLNALQERWESRCGKTTSDLETHHLDTLKHICQTHTRLMFLCVQCASLDTLRPKSERGGSRPSCTSSHQVEGRMDHKAEDLSPPVKHSSNLLDSHKNIQEDPRGEMEGRGISHRSELTEQQDRGREEDGGVRCTTSALGNGLHPPTAEEVDQSDPAEQQEVDLRCARERETKGEKDESDIEEAAEALEMEDEGAEDDGEEKHKGGDQESLSVKTLACGGELEEQQQLLLDDLLYNESRQCQDTQESTKTSRHKETLPPEEAHLKQQEQCAEEEEEEDYEADPAHLIREAPSLDEMARLITVEEISPTSGLVSILKKRSVRLETLSTSVSSELLPENPTAKRRVRFRVPDDGYENDVGSGDSCLLLFLLCLVTVVISIGGTALYCAFGDAQSSVCQDFSRNVDFYVVQMHRGIAQLQHWLVSDS